MATVKYKFDDLMNPVLQAVSYTHLDVYKRQPPGGLRPLRQPHRAGRADAIQHLAPVRHVHPPDGPPRHFVHVADNGRGAQRARRRPGVLQRWLAAVRGRIGGDVVRHLSLIHI